MGRGHRERPQGEAMGGEATLCTAKLQVQGSARICADRGILSWWLVHVAAATCVCGACMREPGERFAVRAKRGSGHCCLTEWLADLRPARAGGTSDLCAPGRAAAGAIMV